jgi:hypothetical protein
MNTCEDLDLFRRIARHYKFYKIDLPLVKFRIHGGNTQQNACAMAKGWEITVRKILSDTPPQFEYYKNEAIIKILSQIAALYKHEGRLDRFLSFCVRSFLYRPSWILKYSLWCDLMRLSLKRIQP